MSGYFPVELLIDILLRLPVKSLIRFTSVCKSWHYLISSSTFISSHLSNQRNQTLLLRRYDRHDKAEHYSLCKLTENGSFCVNFFSRLEFPFKSQLLGYFRIVGSCDGLICLSDYFFANPSQPIILWNPSVKNHVFLPKPILYPEEPHGFVLGFGVASKDYKVVRMVYRRKSDDLGSIVPPEVEIFSLKTGSWRKVRSVDVRLHIPEFMWRQAFLNGAVHWLAISLGDNVFLSSILAFNVDDEVFGEIMLPEDLAQEDLSNLEITLVGDLLGVIKYQREIDDESCDVWVMKEYCVPESWTRLYRIVLVENMMKVIAFCKNGEVLVPSWDHELVTYNPETRHIKDLGIHGTSRSFYIDNYVESLLLLRGQNRVDVEELNADTEEELMKVAFSSFRME